MAEKNTTKFRSIRRRKRKGFCGLRTDEIGERSSESASGFADGRHPSTSVSNVAEVLEANSQVLPQSKVNISQKKLLNSSFEKLESDQAVLTRTKTKTLGLGSTSHTESASGFKLQDASLLKECISSAAICSTCRDPKSKLQLFQNNKLREGLAEHLYLECSICEAQTPLLTSKRLGGRGGGAQEVNRRAVLAAPQLGHAGLTQFCAGMNLPPPVTKKAYNDHQIQIKTIAVDNAETLMKDAAKRLVDKVAMERPDDIEDDGTTVVANVSVTIDGTWQKRGHSSRIGVTFVISVDTGEVLDYCVKSLFCHECKAHGNMNSESEEYQSWKECHEPVCQINHAGSSEEMEAASATEMFGRSISERNLKYTTFVGDGDSSSYGRVKDAMFQKYGDEYLVIKEECVGHVQKRLGTALRKYKADRKGKKLSDGKGVGGRGRLTDKIMDKMQNYYGKAIRGNKGDLLGMKRSIKAIQCHMIENTKVPMQEQHYYCPKDDNTWCKFWKEQLDDTVTYDQSNRLPEVFMEELAPIFTRLSQDNLLSRCLKGITQNQNEAINGMLWSKCPKIKFCGARKVTIAVCETIALFNTGAASKAIVMDIFGITPGSNTMKALRLQDQSRIKAASKKVSDKYQKQRQKLRAQKKSKGDKTAYQAGGFSLSSQPDEPVKKKGKKNPK